MAARIRSCKIVSSGLTRKRIAAAIALSFGAIAGSVSAAGLGRLTVESALGQQLRAQVEVTALGKGESSTLSARLAPESAFRDAGISYSPTLRSLRFAVQRRPDGSAVVQITSQRPLNEPFVELLVELNWSTGRYLREYTFLLDPPELRSVRPEAVEGRSVPQSPVAAAAAATSPGPAAPAKTSRPAAAPVSASAPSATPETITVRRGETLYRIATRVKPPAASLDQTLIALYQANPSAFFGSIHQLKAGATLKVPDQQLVTAVDERDARRQLRIHARDFNAYRARLADKVRTVQTDQAGRAATGTVTARVEDKGTPVGAGDQLKLSKSGAGASAGAPQAATGTATTKTATAEQKVARDAALRESESRVAELEKNVGDLQRLLELKNRQLAELQMQVEAAARAGKSASGTIVQAPAPAPAGDAKPADQKPAPAAPVADKTADTAQKSATTTVEPAAKPAPSDAGSRPASGTQPSSPVAQPASKPAPAAKPAPKPAPAPVAEPGFVDDLLDNPLMLPGIGAILALALGYGWYAMRKRQRHQDFEDSLIESESFASNSLFGTTGGQNVDTSSSVFGASTEDTGVHVHPTEVDPIAEAEVYVAYGREAQAEEILTEALRRQPERQAIRAKLLEIYAGRDDREAFVALATEMHDMTGGRNEEWGKVVVLGHELDPGNPLFAEGAGAHAAAPSDDDDHDFHSFLNSRGAGDEADRLADEPGGPASLPGPQVVWPAEEQPAVVSAPSQASAASGSVSSPEVDFGVLESQQQAAAPEPEKPAPEADKPASAEIAPLDFDFNLAAQEPDDRPDSALEAAQSSELERALDGRLELPSLDLPGGEQPKPAEDGSPADTGASLMDLSFDLPALDSSPPESAPAQPTASADQKPEFDFSSIDLDLQPQDEAASAGASDEEMATKLDLAVAYQEIGDSDGARELLQEVMRQGSAEQKAKARELLGTLG